MTMRYRIRAGLVVGTAMWMGAAVRASAVCVTDPSAQRAHPTAERYGESGARELVQGRPECAVEMYRSALKLEPGNAEWVLGLVSAYDAAGNAEQAGATLVSAVKATPSSARLTGGLVLFLARHGQLDQAYGLAERFAKLHPRDPEAQKVYLRVLVATGDAAARPLAKKLLTAAPRDGELLYLNGVLERKAEEYPAARGHLEASIAQTPEYADSRYNLGVVLARMGEFTGAKVQFEKALALGVAEPEAHLELSKALRALGNEAGAGAELTVYQQAMQANTAKAMAGSKSSEAARAMEKGDSARAAGLYREALEATPGDASLAYELSRALDKLGDLTGERASLEQAVGTDPKLPLAQHQLGYLLSRGGDQVGAETHFRLAVEDDPRFTQAWISLAATLATQGKMTEAKDAVGRALRLDARNAEALQMRRMLVASIASQ